MHADEPTFEAPPINEVAMGIHFAPIPGLTVAHLGLFWGLLKSEFPKIEEAIPHGTVSDVPKSKAGVPLPRYYLIKDDEQYLIQLQPNIFFFNWRQQDESHEYPRYVVIKPLFNKYLGCYLEFLSNENLPEPKEVSCNLTYVNIIPDHQFREIVNDVGGLFPDFGWRSSEDRFLPEPKALNWLSKFDLPNDAGELTVKIQSAIRNSDKMPVLQFELGALGTGSKLRLDEIEPWFDVAHETIVSSFVDLTSSEAQRQIWKRVYAAD